MRAARQRWPRRAYDPRKQHASRRSKIARSTRNWPQLAKTLRILSPQSLARLAILCSVATPLRTKLRILTAPIGTPGNLDTIPRPVPKPYPHAVPPDLHRNILKKLLAKPPKNCYYETKSNKPNYIQPRPSILDPFRSPSWPVRVLKS